MDAIKKKLNSYIEGLLVKDELTTDEYAILCMEYERRKQESLEKSNDTIMRIFANIN